MIAGTAEFPPEQPGDERELARERVSSCKGSGKLGSVPPPAGLFGVLNSAAAPLRGESPVQLLDKLGERLGFERTGVRLYEALLAKFDALGSSDDGPTRPQIEDILRDEFEHFRMLEAVTAELGGDSTVLTPSADLVATMTRGVLEVVIDPRTTFPQCLEAILLIELVDNDAWSALAELAEQAGHHELALGAAARSRRRASTCASCATGSRVLRAARRATRNDRARLAARASLIPTESAALTTADSSEPRD